MPKEKKQIKIDFPETEHDSIKQQLDKQGFVITTRVQDEALKYKKRQILTTPWGDNLKVAKIDFYRDIKDHPYLDELSKEQVIFLSQYRAMTVMRLEKVG